MAVIIELRRRGGQLIERCRYNGGSFRVGRAYDNDVIVDDSFVSPHHIRLDPCEEGWQVTDLDSLNGYRIKSGRRTVKGNIIKSGEELQIGQMTLSVFNSHHAVAPALKVNGFERYLKILGWHRVWPFVIALALGVLTFDLWLRTTTDMKLWLLLKPNIAMLQAMAVIALLWAFAGRIFRHQPMFFSHLSVWAVFFVLSQFGESFAALLGYNAGSHTVTTVVNYVLNFVLLALVIWSSLALAASFHTRGRLLAALSASAIFICWQVLDQWRPQTEFSAYPRYQGGMKLPALTWVAPKPQSETYAVLNRLLDQAEAEAKKEVE